MMIHPRIVVRRAATLVGAMVVCAVFSSTSWAVGFLPVMDLGSGPHVFADYNGDNKPDMFGGTSYWTNVFGDPNTTDPFVETPNAFGRLSGTINTSVGDYNNDGLLDVFGYRMGEQVAQLGPVIYTQNSGGGWTDDSDAKVLPLTPPTTAAHVHRDSIVVDLNGDGYLDMYATAWIEPWLGVRDDDLIYISNGGNTFKNTWQSSPDRYGKGVVHSDFDRDGDQDLFVSNYWLDRSFLWRNDGNDLSDPNFPTPILTDQAGAYDADDRAGHTQGSAFGDWNNDGEFDIFVSNFAHPQINPKMRFLINMGAAGDYHFEPTGKRGMDQQEPQDSGIPADFDNDGDLDILATIVSGYGPQHLELYENYDDNGDFRFNKVTAALGLDGTTQSQHGANWKAAWGDYNDDGFLDLIADNRLWLNPGAQNWPDNHYVKLKLVGGQGPNGLVNMSAIGAQARITIPGLGIITRQVEGGVGQGMQSDLTLHFGLGQNTGPVDVEIFWTDGSTQVVNGLAVDQLHTVTIAGPTVIPVNPVPLAGLMLGCPALLFRPRRR